MFKNKPYHRLKSYRQYIWFVCLYTLPAITFAQNNLKLEKRSPEDGFSYRWVMSFYEDSKGFMWIGTYDGLNRYDGSEYVIYKHNEENPLSLVNNVVSSIQENIDGDLWIFTDTGSSSIYNPDSDQFRKAIPGKDFIHLAPKPHHAIDPKATLWLPELANFIKKTKTPEIFETPLEKKLIEFFGNIDNINQKIISLTKNGESDLWCWLSNGNYLHYNIPQSEWAYYDLEKHLNIKRGHPNMPVDDKGRFWYPSQSKSGELFDFFFMPDGIARSDWIYYRLDNKQNIWLIGAKSKLFEYDQIEKKLKYFGQQEYDVFYEDKEGTKWLGSESGILKITESKQLFEKYLARPFELGGILPVGVSARKMVELEDGSVILKHEANFNMYLLNAEQETASPLNLDINYPSPPSTLNISLDESNTLWLSEKNGLIKYDIENNATTFFPFNHHGTLALAEDSQGRLWKSFGTSQKGERFSQLGFFDKSSGQFSLKKEIYPGDATLFYFQKETQILWIAWKKGMIKVNTLTDKIETIQLPVFKGSDVFGQGNIWCFHSWKGYLWLGSAEGLIQFDFKTNEVVNQYSTNEGLPHNKIYSIESSGDNLWLGTHNGLCRFNPYTSEVKNFYAEDGLSHNEFNRYSSLKTRDGKLWFGTLNGVNAFFPQDLEKIETKPANLIWTKFNTYNLTQDSTTIQNLNSEQQTYAFQLAPQEQEFSLQFALLRFIDPSKNKFTWYLEGLEKPWSQVSHKPIAQYRNVPPGAYTFKVKAIDHRGNPAGNELSATINILQVWYKRWWAWLAYLLAFSIALYSFYRFRLNRRLEQQEAIRLKETDELKTKLYTNITHEFRTPLTVILGMAEQLSAGSWNEKTGGIPEQEIKNKLRLIEQNGGNLLTLVNQMLDLSKLESGSMALNLVNGDLIQYLKYLVDSFESFAASKKIQVHFLSKEQVLEMDYDPEKLKTILSNLLSNAIKFTPEKGQIYIQLDQYNHSKTEGATFLLSVKDTGIGISEDKLPHIFDRFFQADNSHTRKGEGTGIGLALVKEMVKLMKGTITVNSQIGKGTTFELSLPITQTAEKTASAPPLLTSFSKPENAAPIATLSDNEDQPLILLVEDNADVAQYIQSCLSQPNSFGPEGYQIRYAENGQIGIDQAIEHIPDLIISDVMMPEKDGFELVQILKTDERTSHIPIVLLTAKADIDSKIEGIERGADAYLSKPFNEKELKIRLEKLLELRRRLQSKYSKTNELQSTSPKATNPISPTPLEDAFLLKVRNIVEANFSNADFATPHLCRAIGLSKTQLYRKLKALTDQSIAIHIRSIRLQKGKELLKTTDLTIAEIAYEVGFSDPAYFSRTYSAEFGQAPNETRKR